MSVHMFMRTIVHMNRCSNVQMKCCITQRTVLYALIQQRKVLIKQHIQCNSAKTFMPLINFSAYSSALDISGRLFTRHFLCCLLEKNNIENNIYNTYGRGRFTFGSNFQNRARQVVVSLHSHKVKPKPTPILPTLNPILISILSKFLCSIPHFETNPPY